MNEIYQCTDIWFEEIKYGKDFFSFFNTTYSATLVNNLYLYHCSSTTIKELWRTLQPLLKGLQQHLKITVHEKSISAQQSE